MHQSVHSTDSGHLSTGDWSTSVSDVSETARVSVSEDLGPTPRTESVGPVHGGRPPVTPASLRRGSPGSETVR